MTRSVLKHMKVPNYMWGEAVRHATYLINRTATRTLSTMTSYEAFKGTKPNLSHLRVFGCVGYTRVESPHRKKLDDRSRALVHLGTEPGSKAYRLYDPNSKKIIVSRDVIFMEEEEWKWNKQGDKTDAGTFTINLEEFGNRGLKEVDSIKETEQGGDSTEQGGDSAET